MKLTQLLVRNFMPYRGAQAMSFPDDEYRNVVLVFGDNMRGKTSLLNALRWAFYGSAVDRYGSDIPLHRLLNIDAAGDGDWELEVEVKFVHEGRRFDLNRLARRRVGVGRPQRPEDFVVEPTLRIDGDIVRGDLVVHQINQIIPKQISRFFLFDGELLQEYEALLADDGDQGKRIKDAIEQVLGVPSLTNGKSDLRILRKPIDKQWQQDLKQNDTVRQFSERLLQLQRDSEVLDSDKEKVQESLSKFKRSYSALHEQMDAAQSQFAQKIELDQKKERMRQIAGEVREIDVRRLEVMKGAWLDLLRPKFDAALDEVQRGISEKTSEITAQTRSSQSPLMAESLETNECALCLQPLSGEASQRFRAKLRNTAVSDMHDAANRLGDLNHLARRLSSIRYPGSPAVVEEIESALNRLTVEETQMVDKVGDLKRQLTEFDSDRMLRVRREAENTNASIRQLEAKLETIDALIDANSKDKDRARLLINNNESARDQRSSRIVSLVSGLEKCFAESVEKLRDDLRTDIEARATSSFRSLTTDESYRGLRINKNYGLTIIDEHGRDVTLRSAGAEQIVALSLIDGLNQAGRSPGPVIMDTPFGRLDPKHRSRVLKHLPDSSAQVVLFVHEGEVDRDRDLASVASRVGAVYGLERISSSQTRIVKG